MDTDGCAISGIEFAAGGHRGGVRQPESLKASDRTSRLETLLLPTYFPFN